MISAVIFDLDGVLVHTDEYHYLAWKKICERIGAAFDSKLNASLRGVSRLDSLEIILKNANFDMSEVEKRILCQEKNEYYIKLLQRLKPEDISADTLFVLNALRKAGYKLAIGSSSKNARMVLRLVGIEPLFDAISDGNNVVRLKPDPEVFLKAAEYIHEPPSNCIVIEDAIAGILAAKSAGMTAVAFGLESLSPADYHIADMKKLMDLLAEINHTVQPSLEQAVASDT